MTNFAEITLDLAFEQYLDGRKDLRHSTVLVYQNTYKHVPESLGQEKLTNIKFSDIKALYSDLRYEQHLKPRTIELLNSVLHPIFNTALRDQVINYNPVDGALREVARGDAWLKDNKPALSAAEQKRFMKFVRENPQYRRWENLFTFFLGTGCRVGEVIGLRWEDIDFDNLTISINHSTQYIEGVLVEGPPKTRAGFRTIPMLSDVKRALKNEMHVAKVIYPITRNSIPGKKGYVFRNSKGSLHIPATINQAIDNIVKAYNKENPKNPLPHFSVHQLRHTFCTRLCEEETNLKVIQSVMGHSDIKTTMNVYASVTEEKKAISFKKLDGKIIIG